MTIFFPRLHAQSCSRWPRLTWAKRSIRSGQEPNCDHPGRQVLELRTPLSGLRCLVRRRDQLQWRFQRLTNTAQKAVFCAGLVLNTLLGRYFRCLPRTMRRYSPARYNESLLNERSTTWKARIFDTDVAETLRSNPKRLLELQSSGTSKQACKIVGRFLLGKHSSSRTRHSEQAKVSPLWLTQ